MKKKILVIDDERTIRVLLENYLKEYVVITKNDGIEGLFWLQDGNMPDLIIADIQMPNLDGYEFIQQLRASGFFRDIPLIILSGIENSEGKMKCLKLGANDYLVKPFNPEELAIRIDSLISMK